MSKYWSPVVSTLHPYVAGEQPVIDNLTKLNTNENPYGPSPKALAAIAADLSRIDREVARRRQCTAKPRREVGFELARLGRGEDLEREPQPLT